MGPWICSASSKGQQSDITNTNMIMSGRHRIASDERYHATLIDDNFWSKKNKILMIIHNLSRYFDPPLGSHRRKQKKSSTP
jgi:hypothetical protein